MEKKKFNCRSLPNHNLQCYLILKKRGSTEEFEESVMFEALLTK